MFALQRPLLLIVYIHLLTLILLTQRVDCSYSCSQSQVQHYTVSASSGHNTPECASGHSNISCKTLEYLFTQVQSCANVTILDHLTLSSSLKLSSLTDVVIRSKLSPMNISCENSCGLVLLSSQRVHLEGLRFVSCSTKCPHDNADIYPLVDYAALCVSQGNDIAITSCSFLNSSETGVIMHDVIGSNHLVGTNFTGNEYTLSTTNETSTSGGLIIKRQYIHGEATYGIESCHFTDNGNHASYACCDSDHDIGLGGGLHLHLGAQHSHSFVYLNQCQFSRNQAVQGGGVHVNQSGLNSSLNISIHNSLFQYNHADHEGGGMWLTQNKASVSTCSIQVTNSIFSNNSGWWGGGLAVYSFDGNITIEMNHSYFIENNAKTGGYAVATYFEAEGISLPDNTTSFYMLAHFNDCYFINNTEKGYYNNLNSIGAVEVGGSKAVFNGCIFLYNAETALFVHEFAYATFSGNNTFNYNKGIRGAAIYVDRLSAIGLRDGVFLRFEHNYAIIEGGAIFTEPTTATLFTPRDICVFESLSSLLNSPETYKVYFANNTANGENQTIFVGSSENCVNDSAILLFDDRVFTFVPRMKGQILSLPNKITLDCSPSNSAGDLEVMLGQYFYLVPNVTDIFNNTAYDLFGNLQLVSFNDSGKLSVVDDLDLIGPKMIGMDSYTKDNEIFLNGSKSHLEADDLYVAFLFSKSSEFYHIDHRALSVKLVECKVGYVYDNTSGICECVEGNVLSCTPHLPNACIRYGYWLGNYSLTDGKTFPCSGQNCHYADGKCPKDSTCSKSLQDFCRLNDPDDLCWEGRSEIMCSSCRENYSFTFSAVKCVHNSSCTAVNTALIVLGIILYWILNIIFVLVILNLDLRMGLGFMYGIVYYFSVLSLFTDKTITGSVLQIVINTCIAITQLCPRAFGHIAVCFAENWNLNLHHHLFHYVTPLFVIGMIVLIIWLSRYCRCPRAISLAENSSIHAICVLILFSYTALTYTSFEILKPVIIKGEWRVYADPEIKYFGPKHLPYAIVALVSECFISLPICFLLLFAPYLVRRVNLVRLRLKPILDDLQACYRPECCWFAGFYFLARQLMYLANAIPNDSLPQDNAILHFTNAAILVVHSSFQPYKLKWLNVLDTLLLIDLFFLSFFNLGWSSSFLHKAFPYLLILPPALYLLLVIILITARRVFKCLMTMRAFRKKFRKLRARFTSRPINSQFTSVAPSAAPTYTSVGLDDAGHNAVAGEAADFFVDHGEREPLLADSDSERRSYSRDEMEGNRTLTGSSSRGSTLSRFPPHATAKRNATN